MWGFFSVLLICVTLLAITSQACWFLHNRPAPPVYDEAEQFDYNDREGDDVENFDNIIAEIYNRLDA